MLSATNNFENRKRLTPSTPNDFDGKNEWPIMTTNALPRKRESTASVFRKPDGFLKGSALFVGRHQMSTIMARHNGRFILIMTTALVGFVVPSATPAMRALADSKTTPNCSVKRLDTWRINECPGVT